MPKKIFSSFFFQGGHNVSLHAKHLVAHYNEDLIHLKLSTDSISINRSTLLIHCIE